MTPKPGSPHCRRKPATEARSSKTGVANARILSVPRAGHTVRPCRFTRTARTVRRRFEIRGSPRVGAPATNNPVNGTSFSHRPSRPPHEGPRLVEVIFTVPSNADVNSSSRRLLVRRRRASCKTSRPTVGPPCGTPIPVEIRAHHRPADAHRRTTIDIGRATSGLREPPIPHSGEDYGPDPPPL